MIECCRGIWETEYRQNSTVSVSDQPQRQQSSLTAFMAQIFTVDDEHYGDNDFERYINGRPTTTTDWKTENMFNWWATSDLDQLRQWVFDTLSIPAMSAELERVFSQAKRFYTDDRNRLSPDSFEAAMCLKHWSRQDLYSIVHTSISRVQQDWSEEISDQ